MSIRIALPKGKLLSDTAKLASAAGWQLIDYSEGARLYHLNSAGYPELSGKILHEKDIPIQVATGNYDLGICGLDWIQELLSKFPASQLVKLRNLGYGSLSIYLAASAHSELNDLPKMVSGDELISLASEYPNLAETLALNLRLKHFNVYPLWGAAEIYPPENAEFVLLATHAGKEFEGSYLKPLQKVLDSSAYLIANKTSLETKDLSAILNTLYANINGIQNEQPFELDSFHNLLSQAPELMPARIGQAGFTGWTRPAACSECSEQSQYQDYRLSFQPWQPPA